MQNNMASTTAAIAGPRSPTQNQPEHVSCSAREYKKTSNNATRVAELSPRRSLPFCNPEIKTADKQMMMGAIKKRRSVIQILDPDCTKKTIHSAMFNSIVAT